jgi:signal transduction histidine kinase
LSRILLLVDHPGNRRVLADWLRPRHEVIDGEGAFDLCVVEGPAFPRVEAELKLRKEAEPAVFLPVLLVASDANMPTLSRYFQSAIDEVVFKPVQKLELEARVETLLRHRELSQELQRRSEDLEAFIHAMTHDLRAPLRSITGYAEELRENEWERLTDPGRRQLGRLHSATGEMWTLIDSLMAFSRIGRKALRIRAVELRPALEAAIRKCEAAIGVDGRVEIEGDPGAVQADPALLQMALNNLIANAVHYMEKGVAPHVRIRSIPENGMRRVEVVDNGIGIPQEDQERIFSPFVRLHGVEDYAGVGLGLPTVRKVVELMGGRSGVQSAPGQGSTFWIELVDETGHEGSGN